MRRKERIARIKRIRVRIVDIYVALENVRGRSAYNRCHARMLRDTDPEKAAYALEAAVCFERLERTLLKEKRQLYCRLEQLEYKQQSQEKQ